MSVFEGIPAAGRVSRSTSERVKRRAPVLLRNPSISDNLIAFTYAQCVWIAQRDGSDLRPLTQGGNEANPALSPDGKHVAFIGAYDGPRSVYVVPVTGGVPRRLTFHPADLGTFLVLGTTGDMVGWTPDSKRVVFSSRRAAFATGVVQLYTAPVEGGAAVPLPITRASHASFSADGTCVAYVANVQWQPEWKRYRGGQTTSIQIADLANPRVLIGIPRENSNDFCPMWLGNTIYFLSDREGAVALFAYELGSNVVRQVLRHDGFDLKSAYASSNAIIYEQFGSLRLFDIASKRSRELDIRIPLQFSEVRPRLLNLGKLTKDRQQLPRIAARLSPNGSDVLFGVRGEILAVSVADGPVRNLTRTPGIVERDPAWSPDGDSIAYFSDESGEYELHVCECSGSGEVAKIALGPSPTFFHSPTWSPDSSKIAYADKRLNLWYIDLKNRAPIRVDADLYGYPDYLNATPYLQWAWSPDCRWIAYVKELRSHFRALFVYSVDQSKCYQLTDGMSDVLSVCFDSAGDFLYFTASIDAATKVSWLDMSSLRRPVTRSVYAIALNTSVSLVRNPIREDQLKSTLDLREIDRRIVRLPIPAGNYRGLFPGKGGTLFLMEGPSVDDPWRLFAGDQPCSVRRFVRDSGNTDIVIDGVVRFDISGNGERILYARVTDDGVTQWFVGSTETISGSDRSRDQKCLNVDAMLVHTDPRAEWRHMYEQVWRNQRHFFYDPNLHGLDIEAMRLKYEPFLEGISSRDDLDYLFREMLGNLTVGHLAVSRPDVMVPGGEQLKTGLLGADYVIDGGRYKFSRIYRGDVWSPGRCSPLSELGQSVDVNEYLLAVNGEEVYSSADVYSYFQGTGGRPLLLKVGPQPDGSQSREVTVMPVEDESVLRQYEWMERNRRRVDALTNGRVAYVYLPDTFVSGQECFNRYYFAQSGKDALILDVRYGRGGCMADSVIDYLGRRLLNYFHLREGEDITSPMQGIFGPKVMLINEMAGSGSDGLPWMFRRMGFGPLIGKRTWGGLTGAYSNPCDLLDGTMVSTPNLAFYTPEGAWEIENRGVAPDVEVDDSHHLDLDGRDAQLEKAVEVVMTLLKRSESQKSAMRPDYPIYHARGE